MKGPEIVCMYWKFRSIGAVVGIFLCKRIQCGDADVFQNVGCEYGREIFNKHFF